MAWLVGYATEEEKGRLEDRGYVLEDPRDLFTAKVPAGWVAVCVDNTLFDIKSPRGKLQAVLQECDPEVAQEFATSEENHLLYKR